MDKITNVVVVGLGEVGRPIYQIVSKRYQTLGVDVATPIEKAKHVSILHICYPFQIADFIGESARYIDLYRPALTIINSTVAVGTTRAVAERTGAVVVNSPVRGKHVCMHEELLRYTKFIGATDPEAGKKAAEHFQSVGMKTRLLSSPEASELAKLTETTYFGLMIAWAQEVERYCDQLDQNYDEIVSIYDEIKFFPPVRYFSGIIGGHCVMPNIEILRRLGPSDILQAIHSSNRLKVERETARDSVHSADADKVAAKARFNLYRARA